ncbi:hypothetical protein GKQ23_06675 [Erwinia sp. E602]|nr:hypothetical protein [Erwinia sp. E602]QUG74699.1 hypothetical protein GKQ23_06675 [Erwinia sp. E602]
MRKARLTEHQSIAALKSVETDRSHAVAFHYMTEIFNTNLLFAAID